MKTDDISESVILNIDVRGNVEFRNLDTQLSGQLTPGESFRWTFPNGRILALEWDEAVARGKITDEERRQIVKLYQLACSSDTSQVISVAVIAKALAVKPSGVDRILARLLDADAARTPHGYDMEVLRHDLQTRYTVRQALSVD